MNFNTNNSLDSVSAKSTRSKPSTSSAPEAKAPVSTPVPSGNAGDQVVLSQEAQTLGRLQSKIDSAPDVNLDKVAEIRRAIAEGRFEINPERIAENMLNQDLLG